MKVSAYSWYRFTSNWLAVKREVLGCSHYFEFEVLQVTMTLPPEEHAVREAAYDQTARCFRWKKENDEYVPIDFIIYKIDLIINISQLLNIRKELLKHPPTQDQLVSHTKAELLTNICYEHSEIAKRAFENWVRVARWKTGSWKIGQSVVTGSESGWGPYLIALSSLRKASQPSPPYYTDTAISGESGIWPGYMKKLVAGARTHREYIISVSV